MSTKVFLPLRLIHRFTSPFQLRQLGYNIRWCCSLLLQKEKKARNQASYWLGLYTRKSMLRHTIVSAHDFSHISSKSIFMRLISVVKQKSFCEASMKTNSFCIFGKYLAYHLKSFRVPPVVRVPQAGWEPLI